MGGAGYNFEGTYTWKGCYAYSSGHLKGRIYYGTGGTTEEMQATIESPRYRPIGYDCPVEGNWFWYMKKIAMNVNPFW